MLCAWTKLAGAEQRRTVAASTPHSGSKTLSTCLPSIRSPLVTGACQPVSGTTLHLDPGGQRNAVDRQDRYALAESEQKPRLQRVAKLHPTRLWRRRLRVYRGQLRD